jgi:hypothetical protein
MNKVPTDFRRVTMMVNQIEPALTIYRDILEMDAYYDEEIVVSGKGLPSGASDSQARLVILKCNDPYIGMLGIMQYIDPPLPDPGPVYEKLKEIQGNEMVAEPHVKEFPKDDGSVIRVMGISFFDPNGYFIELNQIIE